MYSLVLCTRNTILSDKKILEIRLQELSEVIDNMILDLSTDYPDLVDKLNKSIKANVKKKHITDIKAKEIWRSIATKCHPDKNTNNDVVLHDIFMRAKKYHDEDNAADLYFCYVELATYTRESSLLNKILHQSPVLQESLQILKDRYERLNSSFYGKLLCIYKADRKFASILYKNHLLGGS